MRRVRLLGAIVGVALVVATATVWTWAANRTAAEDEAPLSAATNAPLSWQRPPVTGQGLVQRSGVRLVQVAVTGGGGLLDVRFQVVDPNTAAALHDRATPPAIVDEASGVVANRLLMNHSGSGRFKAGVTYYLIFENPGNLIGRGSIVSVLLGNAQVEHVRVR